MKVLVLPRFISLRRDNWHLFDIPRMVFDVAQHKQKRAWKLVKQAKARSKRKSGTVQRVGSMRALKVRCFTRQRTAIKLYNAMVDVVKDHPNQLQIARTYLYNPKAQP